MYTLIGAITLFLILVTFHEYGHYSVARFFNIKIQKFSIGFGNDLIKWKNKDGVRFSVSAIPLGGYVAFDDPHDVENYEKLLIILNIMRIIKSNIASQRYCRHRKANTIFIFPFNEIITKTNTKLLYLYIKKPCY